MTTRRAQGRPIRGNDDVGRHKLLEGARAFIRARPGFNISRQELAKAAGVTPALVSYYFPDKVTLLEAAITPVLEEHIGRLRSILSSDRDHSAKLAEVVDVFLTFSRSENGILDVYLAYMNEFHDPRLVQSIMVAFGELTSFFQRGSQARIWKDVDPMFLLFATWGICKIVAESPALPVRLFAAEVPEDEIRRKQTTLVLDLIVNGIRGIAPTEAPLNNGRAFEPAGSSGFTAPTQIAGGESFGLVDA